MSSVKINLSVSLTPFEHNTQFGTSQMRRTIFIVVLHLKSKQKSLLRAIYQLVDGAILSDASLPNRREKPIWVKRTWSHGLSMIHLWTIFFDFDRNRTNVEFFSSISRSKTPRSCSIDCQRSLIEEGNTRELRIISMFNQKSSLVFVYPRLTFVSLSHVKQFIRWCDRWWSIIISIVSVVSFTQQFQSIFLYPFISRRVKQKTTTYSNDERERRVLLDWRELSVLYWPVH